MLNLPVPTAYKLKQLSRKKKKHGRNEAAVLQVQLQLFCLRPHIREKLAVQVHSPPGVSHPGAQKASVRTKRSCGMVEALHRGTEMGRRTSRSAAGPGLRPSRRRRDERDGSAGSPGREETLENASQTKDGELPAEVGSPWTGCQSHGRSAFGLKRPRTSMRSRPRDGPYAVVVSTSKVVEQMDAPAAVVENQSELSRG